jgi:hypothetical protein
MGMIRGVIQFISANLIISLPVVVVVVVVVLQSVDQVARH